MKNTYLLLLSLILLAACTSKSPQAVVATLKRPLIIAHRGGAGEQIEHSQTAYRNGAKSGADFIEPDLVCTKDGVLIALHDNDLGATTDVAKKFPKRKRTKTIGKEKQTAFFPADFTLAEIRKLKLKERFPFRDQTQNGKDGVLTFDEVLSLREELGHELARDIGVYPETKFASYHRAIGCQIEQKVIESLKRFHLDQSKALVFIQSTEPESLMILRKMTSLPLVQLTDRDLTDQEIAQLKTFIQAVGARKDLIVPVANNQTQPPTKLVERIHAAGMLVHAWTFRSDSQFLPASYQGDAAAEYHEFQKLGVDGVFTDFPTSAVRALK